MAKSNKARGATGSTGQAAGSGTQPVLQHRPTAIDNGEEARGSVNARENQTVTQPEPDPATLAIPSDSEMADKIAHLRTPTNDALAVRLKEKSEGLVSKQQAISEARQRLAEASDLMAEGGDKTAEAATILGSVGATLYSLRTRGLMSNEELTGLLGDNFGYRMKGAGNSNNRVPAGHPQASKTPFGQGEALRKRVVRLVQAWQYCEAPEGQREASKFFEGMDEAEVSRVLSAVNNGESVFTVFDRFTAMKQGGGRTRTDAAFDPKVIGKIVSSLSSEGAVDAIANSDALLDVYAELRGVLLIIGQEIAKRPAKAAA